MLLWLRAHAVLLTSTLAVALLASSSDGSWLQEANQELPASEPQERAPCGAHEYRQFDFWLGTWRVEKPDGSLAGTNEIRKILNGCALRERWEGAQGMRGTSLNTYAEGRWHQTWVDDNGGLLRLDGGLEGESMVLTGSSVSRRDGATTVRHEITWTPVEGNRVRQVWRTSSDGGDTWAIVFDGLYIPARESR